jgi:antitoxin component of RelBE/YafQ-DinJ toxin-antitoxin module
MALSEIVILRCDGKFKTELETIASRLGVSRSALIRNTLALALLPVEKPSELSRVMAKVKRDRDRQIFGKCGDAKDNGHE